MTTSADLVPQRYVHLYLSIDQHIPGYVDAYFGPPEWRDQAKERPIAELVSEASSLAGSIAGDTEMDPQRRDFLTRQVRAMQTSLSMLQGDQLTLAEETEALYDITPEWVDEAVFTEAHQTLDELLPAGNSLIDRMTTRKKATEIATEHAKSLLGEITAELRRRVRERFPLPPNETFELQIVAGELCCSETSAPGLFEDIVSRTPVLLIPNRYEYILDRMTRNVSGNRNFCMDRVTRQGRIWETKHPHLSQHKDKKGRRHRRPCHSSVTLNVSYSVNVARNVAFSSLMSSWISSPLAFRNAAVPPITALVAISLPCA
jgi:hypothetical protein